VGSFTKRQISPGDFPWFSGRRKEGTISEKCAFGEISFRTPMEETGELGFP
ncbi:hypothetical protein K0M31_004478, partial [Melipona bicolor]